MPGVLWVGRLRAGSWRSFGRPRNAGGVRTMVTVPSSSFSTSRPEQPGTWHCPLTTVSGALPGWLAIRYSTRLSRNHWRWAHMQKIGMRSRATRSRSKPTWSVIALAGCCFLHATFALGQSGWTQEFPSQAPSGRNFHAMVYDADRNEVVLFGGIV